MRKPIRLYKIKLLQKDTLKKVAEFDKLTRNDIFTTLRSIYIDKECNVYKSTNTTKSSLIKKTNIFNTINNFLNNKDSVELFFHIAYRYEQFFIGQLICIITTTQLQRGTIDTSFTNKHGENIIAKRKNQLNKDELEKEQVKDLKIKLAKYAKEQFLYKNQTVIDMLHQQVASYYKYSKRLPYRLRLYYGDYIVWYAVKYSPLYNSVREDTTVNFNLDRLTKQNYEIIYEYDKIVLEPQYTSEQDEDTQYEYHKEKLPYLVSNKLKLHYLEQLYNSFESTIANCEPTVTK